MSELNNELFCKLGELSNDGYFIYEVSSNKFEYLNQSISSIWEIDVKSIKENPEILLEKIHPEDIEHVQACYEECLIDGQSKKYEFRLMHEINREKYVRLIVSPIKEADIMYLIGTVEDTTVMRHNKIHIEQINARKNITLEVLAHDLKEPLGMMSLAASSMEDGIAQTGNRYMINSLEFIKDMCARNLLLVRSMINKEFLKSAEVEIGKERADLVWELRDVVRFYKRSGLSDTKRFSFTTSSDKIYINVDSMKFLQVINNLISNSLKFTDENGFIKVHIEDQPNSVIISVEDNGIGIPEAMQHGLFDRIPETLRPGLKGEESGGFGMSIIKAIVDLHKGKIWFKSKVGIGTTFYIELPK
ncbi:ATP-binding protein [Pedobacter fastidiosus]|uniref:histidine kinase n=1 Tax=Pedobacter fastidiosus TaxID=2765361 RepID=A0ABR7KXZ9_9SPHI|nr:PAS domain-containing sensor histidine kinase [Pedobacter fastidiosus]MBC6112597.1 PAS domain-containing sensor histidine kinase [Pedobacter fastidiosus]